MSWFQKLQRLMGCQRPCWTTSWSNTGEGRCEVTKLPWIPRETLDDRCHDEQVASGRFGAYSRYLITKSQMDNREFWKKPGEADIFLQRRYIHGLLSRYFYAGTQYQFPPHATISCIIGPALDVSCQALENASCLQMFLLSWYLKQAWAPRLRSVAKSRRTDRSDLRLLDPGTEFTFRSSVHNAGLPWGAGLYTGNTRHRTAQQQNRSEKSCRIETTIAYEWPWYLRSAPALGDCQRIQLCNSSLLRPGLCNDAYCM